MGKSDSKSQNSAENYDAERYFLGEMTAAEQEEFELRMFESQEVGDEVVDLYALAANARAVMAEQAGEQTAGSGSEGSWLDALTVWLSPQALLPAGAAALLAVVAYQSFVAIPRMRREIAAVMQPRIVAATVLRPLTRGDDNVVTLNPSQRLVRLSFDVNWTGEPQAAACRVEDPSGVAILEINVEPDELAGSMEIAFPADLLEPGRYALLLFSAERDLEERFEFEVRSSP